MFPLWAVRAIPLPLTQINTGNPGSFTFTWGLGNLNLVLQLKQLSSGKAEEITEGPVSSHQTLPTVTHCTSCMLLHQNSSPVPVIKDLWHACPSQLGSCFFHGLAPLTATILTILWIFTLFTILLCAWTLLLPKKRDWRSSWYGISFFCPKISGISQGFYVVEFMFFSSEI